MVCLLEATNFGKKGQIKNERSFLTFYGLYKDISWKEYIDQFRWLMFLVDSRLNSVYFS